MKWIMKIHMSLKKMNPPQLNNKIYRQSSEEILSGLVEDVSLSEILIMWSLNDDVPSHLNRKVCHYLNGTFAQPWIDRAGPINLANTIY